MEVKTLSSEIEECRSEKNVIDCDTKERWSKCVRPDDKGKKKR